MPTNAAPVHRSPAAAPRAGERGSAYILALLALLVVSVLGFSLVFITQTEMEIGSNERTIQRVFYGADSGLSIATARLLVARGSLPVVVEFREPGSALNIIQRVDIAAAVPIDIEPCNLCEINNKDTYQGKAFYKITNALTARASRVAGGRTLASKTVASMLERQPVQSGTDELLPIGNDQQMAQVRQ